ncbi:MAG TPA: hypothetical protein VHR66_02960 [Gemmataceae bacterium]|jgi:hypothetical protein|nr:hypothetical protein [Gemmataceae bacterium]
MADLNLTPLQAHKANFFDFSIHHAHPALQRWLAWMYSAHGRLNTAHFGGALSRPLLQAGPTPPRAFAVAQPVNGWGATIGFIVQERLVRADLPAHRILRAQWPAEGVERLHSDVLLHLMVHQHCIERFGISDDGYEGHGSRFTAECNRIGADLGLASVAARRRGREREGPLSADWPMNVRPDGYYLGHVVFSGRAGYDRGAEVMDRPAEHNEGVYRYFRWLLNTGQSERLHVVLTDQIDRLRSHRDPAWRAGELAPHGADGEPVAPPEIHPGWLFWDAGTVRLIAEGIARTRSYADMPILADALEDAGCEDPVILSHARLPAEHGRTCWLLRALLARPSADGQAETRALAGVH